MSAIPNLDNLIKAIECEGWVGKDCKDCPYHYQIWDDHGDHPYWGHDEIKVEKDALFYLKLYQHLIEENKNE